MGTRRRSGLKKSKTHQVFAIRFLLLGIFLMFGMTACSFAQVEDNEAVSNDNVVNVENANTNESSDNDSYKAQLSSNGQPMTSNRNTQDEVDAPEQDMNNVSENIEPTLESKNQSEQVQLTTFEEYAQAADSVVQEMVSWDGRTNLTSIVSDNIPTRYQTDDNVAYKVALDPSYSAPRYAKTKDIVISNKQILSNFDNNCLYSIEGTAIQYDIVSQQGSFVPPAERPISFSGTIGIDSHGKLFYYNVSSTVIQ